MEGHAREAFRFPLKSLPLIETFDRTSPPTRLLDLSPPLVPTGAQGPIKLQFKSDNPVTEALEAAFGLWPLLEAPKGGAGRSIKIRSAALSKKLSGEMSVAKGRRHWRRRSRMSNCLKPLIGKEGEKEIKSTEKKRGNGEGGEGREDVIMEGWKQRARMMGRGQAASSKPVAGMAVRVCAKWGKRKQGRGLSRERESKVAKASKRIGDWKMGGGDGGRGEKGPGRRVSSSF